MKIFGFLQDVFTGLGVGIVGVLGGVFVAALMIWAIDEIAGLHRCPAPVAPHAALNRRAQ